LGLASVCPPGLEKTSLYGKLSASKTESANHILVRLSRETAEKPPYYEAAMFHLLAELFILLAREQHSPSGVDETGIMPFHLAERILQYLAEHYAEPAEVISPKMNPESFLWTHSIKQNE
jgi:hypothetical protein